jgi:hypothetical protein
MGMRLGKIAGTLQEMSGEELARQQGLPAAPPTPLGAQGIGASQDVAKMAGTPNQIRAMVQDSLMERQRTRDLLGESERTNGRKRYSVESLQEKMNVLEGLGSLEGRVPAAVRTALEKATTVSVSNTVDTAAVKAHLESLGVKADEAAVKNAVEAVEKIRKAGATPAEVSAALQALKLDATITDGTTTLAGKLAPFFKDASIDDIKKQMATALEDFSDIKMKELPEAEFQQYANPSNLVIDAAQILGLDDGEFGEMTLGEVRAQLKAWKTRSFQDVEILRDVLQDPSYSMAEKDFARQRLAEMGAVGVTSIEQKTNNLEAQVAEGDTVVVGGQAVKVAELMSDPKLKATIAMALESDEELKKLEKTDAQLANWISRNKAALVPVRNELLKGTETFAANNKVFADNIADLAVTHKTFLDTVIPGWNNAKDVAWADWLGSPAAGETPAKGLYATAPTMAHVLAMPDKAKRGVALSALSKLPVEQAKNFSTTFLDQIAGAATSDAEAAQFMEAFLATENKDWITETAATAGITFTPKFDADYADTDYAKAVNKIVKEYAPEFAADDKSIVAGFNALKALTDKITTLRTGGPKDRQEAVRLAGVLADIKGQVNRRINKDTIEEVGKENKTTKEKNSYLEVSKAYDASIEKIKQGLAGRGDWLGKRGAEVFTQLSSAAETIRRQAVEGSITWPEAQNKMKGIQTNMASNLAAFFFDKNHREKNILGAVAAVQLLLDSNLKSSLNPGDLERLRKTMDSALLLNQALIERARKSRDKEDDLNIPRYEAAVKRMQQILGTL